MIQGAWRSLRAQFRSFSAKLMVLYILLLLIPVTGVGLYGHFYIQRTLTQQTRQNMMDEVSVRIKTVEMLLDQIHDDILYLGQQVEPIQSNAPKDPSNELNGFATAHPLYYHIAWLNPDGELLGGYLSDGLAAWITGPTFATVVNLPANSIRLADLPDSPIIENADSNAGAIPPLVAAIRLNTGILLLEVNTNYLLQAVNFGTPDQEWALWIPPDTVITTSENPAYIDHVIGQENIDPRGTFALDDHMNFYQRTGLGGGWILFRSVPTSALNPDLSNYYTTFFVMLVGGLVSVVGFALLGIARIIEPVYQLKTMVASIRRGDAIPRLPSPLPTDEFGTLMIAFERMATELEQKRQSERALVEQLIITQEEQRKLIAYDLHDGLIQQLVGARFYLGNCRKICGDKMQNGGSHDVTRSYDVLTDAISEGRRIIQGLHPTVLDDLGLEVALTELVGAIAETAGWDYELNISPLAAQPDRVTSVTLYRIAQEALNNAAKHAQADHIWLDLHCEEHGLRLTVRDDGCGFDPSRVSHDGQNGWGIKTMQERATMMHGTCRIKSDLYRGTCIEVNIPLQEKEIA